MSSFLRRRMEEPPVDTGITVTQNDILETELEALETLTQGIAKEATLVNEDESNENGAGVHETAVASNKSPAIEETAAVDKEPEEPIAAAEEEPTVEEETGEEEPAVETELGEETPTEEEGAAKEEPTIQEEEEEEAPLTAKEAEIEQQVEGVVEEEELEEAPPPDFEHNGELAVLEPVTNNADVTPEGEETAAFGTDQNGTMEEGTDDGEATQESNATDDGEATKENEVTQGGEEEEAGTGSNENENVDMVDDDVALEEAWEEAVENNGDKPVGDDDLAPYADDEVEEELEAEEEALEEEEAEEEEAWEEEYEADGSTEGNENSYDNTENSKDTYLEPSMSAPSLNTPELPAMESEWTDDGWGDNDKGAFSMPLGILIAVVALAVMVIVRRRREASVPKTNQSRVGYQTVPGAAARARPASKFY
jgi:hypothetical protein